MFSEKYRKVHEMAEPGEWLVTGVIGRAGNEEKRRRNRWRRGLCAAAAAAACVFGGLPLAAASQTGYRMMYAVSPGTAQFFTPVQRSDEDQGIRMEVEAARVSGNKAEIYVNFRDLTGDRLDGSTDLFDSYSINRTFDGAGGCFPLGYDAETGKARFLISIEAWGDQKITGRKITFSVRELLSRKQTYEGIEIPLDLGAVGAAAQSQVVDYCGGSEVPQEDRLEDGRGSELDFCVRALVPGEPMEAFPVEGIDLTAIGFLDGKLHIQTAVKFNESYDNHGYFYLVDESGNEVGADYNFYFRTDETTEERTDYQDYVFGLPASELGKYSLYGWFQTGGELTKGNWRVTIPLENRT